MILKGFWLKILFAILYILITQFYYGGSDGFMYFEFGQVIHNAISANTNNAQFLYSDSESFYEYVDDNSFDYVYSVAGYMYGLSNQIVARVSCVFGYLCFQNYTIISLFFSMLSYIGIWKMFLIFYKIYPQFKKEISISFLYLPSFLFWSSGLMKEPICLWALGLIIAGFYNLFYFKKISFWGFVGALIGCWFLYIVKSYIFYSICGALFILGYRFYTKNMTIVPRLFLSVLIFGLVAFGFSFVVGAVQNDATSVINVDDIIEQTATSKTNYEDMGGAFVDIGDVDPSVFGIIKKIPVVIVVVFFRPFPWEARSLVMIISMFESMFFVILILRAFVKTNFGGFFNIILKNPIYLSCLIFSVFLGIIVGLTTFNFGTIIRYKIPCMPFFCMILLFLNKPQNTESKVVENY